MGRSVTSTAPSVEAPADATGSTVACRGTSTQETMGVVTGAAAADHAPRGMRAAVGRASTEPFDLPPPAFAAALASVPGIGPKALRCLLDAQTPESAWSDLVEGRPRSDIPRWASAVRNARGMDVAAVWGAHVQAGVTVTLLGQAGYPAALADDPEAPAVLFSLGDLLAGAGQPCVALVGTRSATRYGLGVAAQLGADLAAVGVVVVSGLALGIDGAAHEGALAAWRAAQRDRDGVVHEVRATREAGTGGEVGAAGADAASAGAARAGAALEQPAIDAPVRAAPPVGVVAGSLASPYPRQHAGLWRRVAEAGSIISEAPLASADLGWRFPQRNRIIAAMADVVVVVECHPSGGSMHTVQAAARRGVPVGAVPGSIRSPASAGTNALLADGCFVVRDASDVLVAVGLATASAPAPIPAAARRTARRGARRGASQEGRSAQAEADATDGAEAAWRALDRCPELATGSGAVLEALGWERCSVDELLRRTGLELDVLSATLERLRFDGLVEGAGGAWERTDRG
jgi:DNA processing protein